MKARWEWLNKGGGGPGPLKKYILLLLFSATDGEARTFNGSIELCRADSDSSQKVGSWRAREWPEKGHSWPVGPQKTAAEEGPGLCLLTPHSCSFL